MRRHHSTRLVVALTVPALAAAILIPGAAAFAGSRPKPVKGSCTSMSGNITSTVTVSGCTPSPNATPTGTFSGFGTGNTSGAAVLTWTNGNLTHLTFKSKGESQTVTKTKRGVTSTLPNPKYHCPQYGDQSGIQAAIKGKITTQTVVMGTGLKGAIKGTVCVDLDTGTVALVAGTVFAL